MQEAGRRERGDSGGEQRDCRSLASKRLPAPECAAPLFSFELKSGSVAALNRTSASFLRVLDFDVALRGKTTKHEALVSPNFPFWGATGKGFKVCYPEENNVENGGQY